MKVNIKNKAGKEKYREISCESPGVEVEQDSSEVKDHHNVSYDSQHHVEKRRTESEIHDISVSILSDYEISDISGRRLSDYEISDISVSRLLDKKLDILKTNA